MLGIILLLLAPFSAMAYDIDYEMLQSLKCTHFFSYFERKYLLPIDSLHSISLKESGKIHSMHKFPVPWPWTANIDGKGYYFANKRQAVYFIESKLRMGKNSIDVGCMQINLKHHGMHFRSVSHAIEPKFNIEYAAHFLSQNFQKTGNWHQAVAYYHSRTHALGERYSNSVFQIAKNLSKNKRKIIQFYANK